MAQKRSGRFEQRWQRNCWTLTTVSPRERRDSSGRRCGANGVIDGSPPTAQGRSPVSQGGSRHGIRKTGHWRASERSDVPNQVREQENERGGGGVPVYSSGAYIAPITGLIFHPEAWKKERKNSIQSM